MSWWLAFIIGLRAAAGAYRSARMQRAMHKGIGFID